MADINEIAKDIAVETRGQGEKMVKLDDNMAVAEENTTKALDELKEAAMHAKKSGKCNVLLLSIIVICILVLILSVALWVRKV